MDKLFQRGSCFLSVRYPVFSKRTKNRADKNGQERTKITKIHPISEALGGNSVKNAKKASEKRQKAPKNVKKRQKSVKKRQKAPKKSVKKRPKSVKKMPKSVEKYVLDVNKNENNI